MSEFRYSLNSSTIRPTPLLEKIRVAASAGYTGIELWHADLDEFLDLGGALGDVKKSLTEHGLSVPTTIMLKGWCEPDGAQAESGWDDCRRRLEQAAEVGAPHAIAGPPHGRVDLDFVADRYHRLLEYGRTLNVRPSVEYLGFAETVCTGEAAQRIMTGSRDSDATIILDPFHDFRGGGGSEHIARLRPEQIAVCHFNDAPAHPPREQQQDRDRVLPGQGVIDLRRFIALLRQVGYASWISLEVFREDLWRRDPEQVAREGLAAMRSMCEEDAY